MATRALASENQVERTSENQTTLARKLTVLAAIAIIPLSIFATSIVLWSLYKGRETAQQNLDQTAHGLTIALEEQIVTWQAILTGLSTSSALDRGDYAEFRRQAEAITRKYGGWIAASLPSGKQVVNTYAAAGAPLPHSNALALPPMTVTKGHSHVSDLFLGPVAKRVVIAVTVPVVRSGRVTHVLHLGVLPENLFDLLVHQRLPRNWIAALLDSEHRIIACAPQTLGAIGSDAPEWFLGAIAGTATTSTLRGRVLDRRMHGTRRALGNAAWTLVLAAPDPEFASTWRRPLVVLALGGIVLIIGIGAVFAVIGRQLAIPINELAAAARAAMQGELLKQVRAPKVRELDELRNAVMALSRKQILFREASHRIKNGLQLVSSSLGLQARGSVHPELKEEYRAAQSHIDAIARLHQRLYETDEYESVDAFALVRAICADIAAVCAEQATVGVEIEDVAMVSADSAGPLALIVAELVTNAVKHAPQNGVIEVHCRMESTSTALIKVHNGGPSLPPDFDLTAQAGLGLRMCAALAEQIHGSLRASSCSEGATFELRAPVSN